MAKRKANSSAIAVPLDYGIVAIGILAFSCFLLWTGVSWARWASFAYRTFDLAYYVQALWQFNHGRFEVTVEDVPLLGNHVEPIVFLIAPIFFFLRHPMLFVALQNGALAAMGPVAYSIAKQLGLDRTRAFLLAAALLCAPATGYVALHEFHPEAFAPPFLLLMLRARLANSLRQHWLWFIAVLACKENMALLLACYCAVQSALEYKKGLAYLRDWFLMPTVVAVVWFLLCVALITPTFNSGNINYATLYDRLGSSAGEILFNAFARPGLIFQALSSSLRNGNLLWGVLFPFLCLPLVRPRWLLISAPILLQHLLSWRSSEWTIYFHYAAPLIPLFWFAAAQALAPGEERPRLPIGLRRIGPAFLLIATIGAQFILGPLEGITATGRDWVSGKAERARRQAWMAGIPEQASVVAPLPYLSHLAMREKLYSLHYILKGLKTLSHASFEPPPPTDFALIDYADSATFDAAAGFYHPEMKTIDGRVIPSSDQLLHDFLTRGSWQSQAINELTKLQRADATAEPLSQDEAKAVTLANGTRLLGMEKSGETLSHNEPVTIKLRWQLREGRAVFPWLELRLRSPSNSIMLTRGLCAPELGVGAAEEAWQITLPRSLPQGDYLAEAVFSDHAKRVWSEANGQQPGPSTVLAPPIALGNLRVP